MSKPRHTVKRQISLPAKLAEELQKHPEVNWSEVCRRAMHEELKRLRRAEREDRDQ
jgi:hypothetical protein